MARKSATAEAVRYDVHPGVAMVRKWADELPAKTGRSLEQWADLVRKSKLPAKEKREWLKREYGHGTNTAWWLVEYSEGSATWDGDPEVYLKNAAAYVEEMFTKGKEWQRPIFEAVVAYARTLGPGVKVCPCQTIVPLYRNRVFAELKPATKTRLELALVLGEVPFAGRLQPNPRAKGNDRRRHLIALTEAEGFDAEARKWLKAAYKADA
jgi:uncharacterized protein DUF5655/uncharacterized protein DUF4287